jgi:hypothetical protein
MEPIPDPPPPVQPATPPSVFATTPPPQRAGQLTSRWTVVFWVAWAGVAGSFAAVWYSSRMTGFSTWWLGPETEPRMILINLLPFVAPLALAVMAFTGRPWMPWFGIGGACITALIALGDVGRVNGYALVEFGLAFGGLLVSVAAFSGMLRAVPRDDVAGPVATG